MFHGRSCNVTARTHFQGHLFSAVSVSNGMIYEGLMSSVSNPSPVQSDDQGFCNGTVRVLEELLDQARLGKLLSIAFVTLDDERKYNLGWSWETEADREGSVCAIQRLMSELYRRGNSG